MCLLNERARNQTTDPMAVDEQMGIIQSDWSKLQHGGASYLAALNTKSQTLDPLLLSSTPIDSQRRAAGFPVFRTPLEFFFVMEGSTVESRLDFGKMGYGCRHYRRRCRIRSPCCSEIFHCRHCHDESTKDRHEISRFAVERVICAICDTEQSVAQICSNCGIKMGEYFCSVCKFYDDDIEKEQFHCDDCGICRIGGREKFFHCQKCGTCYSTHLRNKHACVENSMRHDCSICFEYLFDSIKETSVLKCGHTMHLACLHEMLMHEKYCCPICAKSVTDMSNIWKKLDEEIEATEMPEDYRSRKVWILCNDCNDTTEVLYHIIGQKCSHCRSYNTRIISPPTIP